MSKLGITILLLVGWLVVGIISFVVGVIVDLHDSEYDEYYLNDMGGVFIAFLLFGYFAPILTIATFVDWIGFQSTLTEILYNIANPNKNTKEDK